MAHGHDEISMRILKICGSSACRPLQITLREKCPNTEFFLVREYLSIFSPNAGKYGPEKTPHLDTFHAVIIYKSCLDRGKFSQWWKKS